MSARYTYDELGQPGNYNLGKNLVSAARTAVCTVYNNSPGWMTYKGGDYDNLPGGQFARGFWDSVCDGSGVPLPPRPQKPFNGGQCPGGLYTIEFSVTSTRVFNGVDQETITQTSSSGVEGGLRPVGLIQKDGDYYYRVFVAVGGSGGSQGIESDYPILDVYNPAIPAQFYRLNSFSVSVSPQPGNPDNCGDTDPIWDDLTPPSSSLIDNVNINVDVGVNVSIPVTINNINNSIDNSVNVNFNNDFGVDINFDLGGGTVNYPGGGTGGNVDLTPVLNATTQIQRDLNDTYDVVNDIFNARLMIKPNVVSLAGCEDGQEGELQVTVTTLEDENGNSLGLRDDIMFAELFKLRTEGSIKCGNAVAPAVILEGDTLDGEGVFFTDAITPRHTGFLVQIIQFDPAFVRTYKLNESSPEAGFGNAVIVGVNGAAFGDFTRVWLADTFISAYDVRVPHGLRLSLKRGIVFRVVSLGYDPLLFDGW